MSSGPTNLGEGLRRLLKQMDKGGHLTTARIIEVWDSLVGPEIAGHTQIQGVRDGQLLVYVDSPVWANELQAMAGQLLERLQIELGENPIRSMRFTVTKSVSRARAEQESVARSERRYGAEHVDPEPLSPEELAAVERSVAGIENEKLRDAALRATIRDLEWKKGQERNNAGHRPSGAGSGTK